MGGQQHNEQQAVSVASIQQCGDVDDDSVVVRDLTFGFPTSGHIIKDFSLPLPKGSRAILCGANGAGKTTLLQILGGKYMVGKDTVRLLGRPAFHDLQLVSSGEVSFLGGTWRREWRLGRGGWWWRWGRRGSRRLWRR